MRPFRFGTQTCGTSKKRFDELEAAAYFQKKSYFFEKRWEKAALQEK
jgi:hypothetical protein